MSIEKIPNAFLDNVGVEKIAAAIRQTTVGIGNFDGYAARVEYLPETEDGDRYYLVGDESRKYFWDGHEWQVQDLYEILAIGALFYILDKGKITKIGRFTSKPQYYYDDGIAIGIAEWTGECELIDLGSGRALTLTEIDELLAAAGF